MPTELESLLKSLESLSPEQVEGLVKDYVAPEDAEAFAALVDGLSNDAVRFLVARALLGFRLSTGR